MPSQKAVGLVLEDADRRSRAAMQTIAETLGVDPPEEVNAKHGQVQQMREAEAMADWLEEVADALSAQTPQAIDLQAAVDQATEEELEALVGVGRVTAARMMEGREERKG